MAPDHRMYLAENVLNEQRIVSYRTLSRAMGVHVNQAKRMLFDFYERENSKKRGSVHAMYLIAGTKKSANAPTLNGHTNGGGDDINPSSPIMSSSMPQPVEDEEPHVPVKTIILAREEDLEGVRTSLESITSIHIYSLEVGQIQDLQSLTEVGREIFATTFVKEDPLEHYKKYGIIQNRFVKRRTGVKPPLPAVTVPTQPEKKAATAAKPDSKPQPSLSTASGPFAKSATLKRTDSQDSNRTAATTASSTKPATLKRDASSIFKSFAKAPPKEESQEDTAMKDAPNFSDNDDDDDEEQEEAMFLDTGERTSSGKTSSKSREEREERARKLRKMMEDSDEEDEKHNTGPAKDEINLDNKEGEVVTTTTIKKPNPDSQNPNPEAEQTEDAETEWPSSPEPEPEPKSKRTSYDQEPSSTTTTTTTTTTNAEQPRRRRARRKVMKKRTMKDEEGYLVTKEEAVWESFSEDDDLPAPPSRQQQQKKKFGAEKKENAGTAAAGEVEKKKGGNTAAKGKSGGGGGGGNIMSFFKKG